MADESHSAASDQDQPLPDCPELALFVAGLFRRLGGQLSIDNGVRRVWKPEPAYFRLQGKDLPQLPGAALWEQFHSSDEWRGALKVAEYWLARLSEADKEFVFTLLAPVGVGGDRVFDFREQLQ